MSLIYHLISYTVYTYEEV